MKEILKYLYSFGSFIGSASCTSVYSSNFTCALSTTFLVLVLNNYKFLNTNTKKVLDRVNVKFDEYTKVHEVEPMKEPEEYKSFV